MPAINELTFAFIDIETTGLTPAQNGRICEVAVLRRQADKRLDEFCQLINPRISMPEEVVKIHGITDDMLASAPDFAIVAPKLISMLENSVVVCHNACFDIPFLAYEFYNAGYRFPPSTILDTLEYARKRGNFASNKLGNIAGELGFSNGGWHRAMADAVMTEKIFLHFLATFEKEGAKTLSDLEKLQSEKIRRNK
ncbi:MAG: 3'-5' exonuclease [Elusimicrobia bacterium]|nr:3'-5' exonuclease [Elusimicrobiota bacterium]